MKPAEWQPTASGSFQRSCCSSLSMPCTPPRHPCTAMSCASSSYSLLAKRGRKTPMAWLAHRKPPPSRSVPTLRASSQLYVGCPSTAPGPTRSLVLLRPAWDLVAAKPSSRPAPGGSTVGCARMSSTREASATSRAAERLWILSLRHPLPSGVRAPRACCVTLVLIGKPAGRSPRRASSLPTSLAVRALTDGAHAGLAAARVRTPPTAAGRGPSGRSCKRVVAPRVELGRLTVQYVRLESRL